MKQRWQEMRKINRILMQQRCHEEEEKEGDYVVVPLLRNSVRGGETQRKWSPHLFRAHSVHTTDRFFV